MAAPNAAASHRSGRLSAIRSFLERFRRADPGLMAAAVAFNAFFALVPVAFAFVTAASQIGANQGALRQVEETLISVVPPDAARFLLDVVTQAREAVEGQAGSIIAVALVVALWSGSRGTLAFQKALARIEGLEEDRPRWRVRLIAIAMTIGAGITLIAVSFLVVAGEFLTEVLEEWTSWGFLDELRLWLGFPALFLAGFLVLYALFRWGPPEPLDGATPAAVVGTLMAMLTSLGFAWYLQTFGLGTVFGVLGAVAVALVWLYLTVYVLLFVAAAIGFRTRYVEATQEMEAIVAESEPPGAR